ncbi:hypothetical protein IGI04_029920 [Brassica rapa subsp. trilocularis]|uniref:Uncharacterized protein n=1 Tax=Brassica rapa subsp. trilocularis TaxID=1813537 RepID=A0ABQ7LSF7_BRACM|nr:hypothetical protein IGI04_029920 [Brassica rapa subsp. trilocularis]
MLALVVVPYGRHASSTILGNPKGRRADGNLKLPDAEFCAFILLKLIIFGNPANKILKLISKLLTNVWKRTMEQSRRTLSSINLTVVVRPSI